MSELTKDQKLAFVVDNAKQVTDYDVNPLFYRVYNGVLTNVLGCYVDNGSNVVEVHSNFRYRVNYNISIEANVTAFNKMLQDRNMSGFELKLYMNTRSLLHSSYFRKSETNKGGYSIYGEGNKDLLFALRYVRSGILDDDYQPTNALADELGIKYNSGAYAYTIGNISVKRFQNGRLDIKGMTDEQQNRLDKIFVVGEKAKTFIPRN